MKISIITITARTNYPYTGRPNLELFEPTIESLKAQTMTDFEWIIVDYLYEERKDYFKNRNLPFHIKHIPSSQNIWHDVGLPGVCTQYNKGIIYADGELLYFSGDGYLFPPNFCEKLWDYHKQGYIPLVWYFFDNTFVSENDVTFGSPTNYKKAYPSETEIPPIPYNICGYNGKRITTEHRPLVAFKNNSNMIYKAPWEWWFCCSATPLNAMLKINGFDQRFDGDRMLLDCDVGSRLQLAEFNNFALFRDLFVIRPKLHIDKWNENLQKDTTSIKCNLPLIYWSRNFNRYIANDHENVEDDIKWAKEEYCAKQCIIRESCKTNHAYQYPFEHKEGYGYNCYKKRFDYWKSHIVKIDISEERNKRISGDKKYKEGTFV